MESVVPGDAENGDAKSDENASTENSGKFGFTDEQLAAHETVYRDDLLKGQRVVITGGGSGMGRAMAFLYARLGADVMICGRREEKLRDTQEAAKRLIGRDIAYKAMTIRDPDRVDELYDEIYDQFGGLDVLINNAGGQFPQNAIDFSRKGWLAVIDTNLNGTWWMMQTAARRWKESGQAGNIINIVANVQRGMPQAGHTCAARAGVIYLSKTVSTEWAPLKIRVNCVAPGAIETEGFNVYPPHALTRFHESNPMKKLGDAWDIAEACVYLSSNTGKFVTGEVLTIDGGMAQWGWVWPGGRPEYF